MLLWLLQLSSYCRTFQFPSLSWCPSNRSNLKPYFWRTLLNAAGISAGTLDDARLSSNVALLNANQTFTGQNIFNHPANSFSSDGRGLINLNASNLVTGTAADHLLSSNVAQRSGDNTLSGVQTFTHGAVQIATNSSPFFGNGPLQMINLWGTQGAKTSLGGFGASALFQVTA